MADNNSINRDNQPNVAEDDPFAELARIMNQGARGSEPSTPTEEPEPESIAEDPFAVDLERELLGDLGEVDAAYAAEQPAEPEFETSADETPAADFAADDHAPEYEAAVEDDLAYEQPAEQPLYDEDHTPVDPRSEDNWRAEEALPAGEEYWANSEPLRAQPLAAADDRWHGEPENAAGEDTMLADVDMDFGDLDSVAAADASPTAEDELASSGEEIELPAAAPDAASAGSAVSLEDELEMLLAGGSPAPEYEAEQPEPDFANDEPDAEEAVMEAHPEPAAQPWRSRIFGRANFASGSHSDDADTSADEPMAAHDDAEESGPEAGGAADPFTELAAITAAGSAPERAPHADKPPVDFETVDVPEPALALDDDLELPDLPEEEPASLALDDEFENEFAYEFPSATPAGSAAADTPEPTPPADARSLDDEDRFYAETLGFGAAAARGFDADRKVSDELTDDEIDRELEEAMVIPDAFAIPPQEKPERRNGFLIAGVVIGVALIGGIGAFALSFGGGDESDAPVLVAADNEPMKVKPENPGGATDVPNQDSVAYDAATGGGDGQAPQQESLVSTTEEPVNIASRTVGTDRLPGVDEDLQGTDGSGSGKAEDRLAAAATETAPEISDEVIAVQPRKVRTMIVRPDGTLVPREPEATEEAAPPAATVAAEQPAPTAQPEDAAGESMISSTEEEEPVAADSTDTPAGPTVAAAEALTNAETTPAAEEAVTEIAAAEPAATQPSDPVTPRVGPVAPSRPANQGTEQPQQVAQAAPAATRTQPAAPAPAATASSEWSMQIASQPTAESAQATYQELARRYGNLLDGRGVNIVRAEIAGKGTYYRVRIPTASRNDGIALCERYKAAGGSCFVSK